MRDPMDCAIILGMIWIVLGGALMLHVMHNGRTRLSVAEAILALPARLLMGLGAIISEGLHRIIDGRGGR